MQRLATAQQIAAFVIENDNRSPTFEIRKSGDAWTLSARADNEEMTQSTMRDVATPRRYKTIEAAMTNAQQISRMAGREPHHAWTGAPESLAPMPEIKLVIGETA